MFRVVADWGKLCALRRVEAASGRLACIQTVMNALDLRMRGTRFIRETSVSLGSAGKKPAMPTRGRCTHGALFAKFLLAFLVGLGRRNANAQDAPSSPVAPPPAH